MRLVTGAVYSIYQDGAKHFALAALTICRSAVGTGNFLHAERLADFHHQRLIARRLNKAVARLVKWLE